MQHYTLVGREWEEVIGARNDAMEFCPNYEAPVVVMREGQRVIETMRWGFPPPPGVGSKAPVVNVRNAVTHRLLGEMTDLAELVASRAVLTSFCTYSCSDQSTQGSAA